MNIDVDITFWGGMGEVNARLIKNGETLQTLVFTQSGTQTFTAQGNGFYVIATSFKPSAPDGTDITIHTHTTPITPERVPAGIYFRNYSFSIRNQ
jgi:hypothetical protein